MLIGARSYGEKNPTILAGQAERAGGGFCLDLPAHPVKILAKLLDSILGMRHEKRSSTASRVGRQLSQVVGSFICTGGGMRCVTCECAHRRLIV